MCCNGNPSFFPFLVIYLFFYLFVASGTSEVYFSTIHQPCHERNGRSKAITHRRDWGWQIWEIGVWWYAETSTIETTIRSMFLFSHFRSFPSCKVFYKSKNHTSNTIIYIWYILDIFALYIQTPLISHFTNKLFLSTKYMILGIDILALYI